MVITVTKEDIIEFCRDMIDQHTKIAQKATSQRGKNFSLSRISMYKELLAELTGEGQ